MSALSFLALLLAALPTSPAPSSLPASAPAPARASRAAQDADLLVRGRALLESGRAAEAQALFETADQAGSTLETRVWLLRSWQDQGRINDAFDGADELAKKHVDAPELDYLYGMGFARGAEAKIALGVQGDAVRINDDDCAKRLERALAADGERFRDGWLALSRAAERLRRMELARSSAEQAVQRLAGRPEAELQLGRVALAQYALAKDDPAREAEASAHRERAEQALQRAAELARAAVAEAGADAGAATRARAIEAEAWRGLAQARTWKDATVSAVEAWAHAIELAPAAVDYNAIRQALGADPLLDALERAWTAYAPASAERPGADTATLLWWLGWCRYTGEQYRPAAEAFQQAAEAWPAYVNSLYYLARSRLACKEYDAAIAALKEYAGRERADLGRVLALDRAGNLTMLDILIGHAYGPYESLAGRGRMEEALAHAADAGLCADLRTGLAPTEPQGWSNLGLFLRDQGDILARLAKGERRDEAMALWERSLAAYERALGLSPEDPDVLNDTAVVLHYNLGRDLERALSLYKRAEARCDERLAAPNLAPEQKAHLEELRGWARDNVAKVQTEIDRRARKAAEAAAPPPGGAGGSAGGGG